MSDLALLDRAFANIIQRFVRTGQAPRSRLAKDLGLSVEQGRELVHELFARNVPGWVHPGTDLISSLRRSTISPPNTASPSTADQKWLAGSSSKRWRSAGYSPTRRFESMLRAWTAESRYVVKMRRADARRRAQYGGGLHPHPIGSSARRHPLSLRGDESLPVGRACAPLENVTPEMEKTLRPLSFWADLFSEQLFRQRGRPDYMTWLRSNEGRESIASLWARNSLSARRSALA